MDKETILNNLNTEQQKAVKIINGPVLVLAGAGSGKTRVLTQRIAYLIAGGVNPLNILGITFTNKAAGEMKERVKKALYDENINPDNRINMPTLGTFHSVCVRILRREISSLGIKPAFAIYDDDDQMKTIKSVMKDKGINTQRINPRAIQSLISSAKNDLLDPAEYEGHANSHIEKLAASIYQSYQNILKQNNACDFDDLIFYTVKIFQKYPEVLKKYQNIFKFILVDEYQDTNNTQYQLVNLLAKAHKNIFVVGDDWQSIYGWRGADIKNILSFEKDFKGAQVIKLERNYRSTQNILDTAHDVITKNFNQKDKKLWTDRRAGDKAVVYEAGNEKDEGKFVVEEIQKLLEVNGELSYNDFVVLYRTNAQSRALEEVLLQFQIPYRIIGGVRFYERREIKDTLAFLKIIHNPQDSIALQRVINVPGRGVGEVTFKKIEKIAADLDKRDLLKAINKYLEEKNNDKLKKFANAMIDARAKSKELTVTELIDYILEQTGYKDFILDGTQEGEYRWENIMELKSVANNYDGLSGVDRLSSFLEDISLVSDTDQISRDDNAVTLMTVHSAKGLEYEAVFIVGMEENIFPHSRSMLDFAELEEERRLCYVAMTRAKKYLYMVYTQAREIYGSLQSNLPSRFLEDISSHLLEYRQASNNFLGGWNNDVGDSDSGEDGEARYVSEDINIGDQITHPKFGLGVIKGMDESVIEINFQQYGIKKLAKDYAPIVKREED